MIAYKKEMTTLDSSTKTYIAKQKKNDKIYGSAFLLSFLLLMNIFPAIPMNLKNQEFSNTSFSSISSIHEANDSEDDEDDDGKNHSAIVSTSQSMRNSTDDMLNPNQSVRNMNRSDRSTTRGTEVQW